MTPTRIRLPETSAAPEQPYTIQPALLVQAPEPTWLAVRQEGLASDTIEPSYPGETVVHQVMGLEADINVWVGLGSCGITIRNGGQVLVILTDTRFTEIGQAQR